MEIRDIYIYTHMYVCIVFSVVHSRASTIYLDSVTNSTFVTVFRKTKRSARKSIIACARKYAFEHEDANVNKEKETRFTPRRSIGLASNLDGGIFARRKRQQSNKKEICFSR